MANFITDELIDRMVGIYKKHLEKKKEKIDDLFGDQGEDKNRRVTVNHRTNLSAKSETAVEIKSHIDFVVEAGIPARKEKDTIKEIFDTVQGVLDFPPDGAPNKDEE